MSSKEIEMYDDRDEFVLVDSVLSSSSSSSSRSLSLVDCSLDCDCVDVDVDALWLLPLLLCDCVTC